MRRILILISAAIFLATLSGRAADASAKDKPPENRFLFIVDTAYAMRSYSNAIVQNVVDLIGSDMTGEFREGDTIGLWTYNDTLHPEFPMQVWSKNDKGTIAGEMAVWLQGRRFTSHARLAQVLPALSQVIRNSKRITAILIFDGMELVQGTPFDQEINGLQKKYARELKAAHTPFILVLAARNGMVFDYTINYPGLVAIPHTALPIPPPVTNAPPPKIVIEPPPVPRVGPPIYLTGPQPAHPREPEPEPAPVQAVVTAPIAAPPPPPVQNAPPPALVAPVAVATPPPATPVIVSAPTVVTAPVTPPPAAVVAPAAVAPPPTQAPPVEAHETTEPVKETVETPAPVAKAAPVVAPAPAPVAVAAAGGFGVKQMVLLGAAFLLLMIAVAVALVVVRRSRPPPQSSLISQSLDRPR